MITIKTNGIEITVETAEELVVPFHDMRLEVDKRNMRAARRQLELFLDDGIRERITVALALLDESVDNRNEAFVEEPKQPENNSSNVTHINTVNGQSRYYTHVPPGTRRFRSVARIYDYVESHKRGRTTMQVVERFGISKYSANSTLNTLKNEGLIYQPNGRGTAWLATVDVSAENSVNEDNHANES